MIEKGGDQSNIMRMIKKRWMGYVSLLQNIYCSQSYILMGFYPKIIQFWRNKEQTTLLNVSEEVANIDCSDDLTHLCFDYKHKFKLFQQTCI